MVLTYLQVPFLLDVDRCPCSKLHELGLPVDKALNNHVLNGCQTRLGPNNEQPVMGA